MKAESGELRCQWGRHVGVTEGQAKAFHAFFDHAGAGGFKQYHPETDTTLKNMVLILGGHWSKNHSNDLRAFLLWASELLLGLFLV